MWTIMWTTQPFTPNSTWTQLLLFLFLCGTVSEHRLWQDPLLLQRKESFPPPWIWCGQAARLHLRPVAFARHWAAEQTPSFPLSAPFKEFGMQSEKRLGHYTGEGSAQGFPSILPSRVSEWPSCGLPWTNLSFIRLSWKRIRRLNHLKTMQIHT